MIISKHKPIFYLFILTFLMVACGPGTPDEATLAQLNSRLHDGIRAVNWQLIDSCLSKGADINAFNEEGTPSVIFAAQTGNPTFLERLIRNGLEVNLKRESNYGSTALMETGAVNDTIIGAILLKHGARVNAVDTFGDPAINWAAYYGNIAYVDLLLQNGADTDIESKHGDAFDVALKQWQDDLVEYLIKKGYGTPLESEIAKNLVTAVKTNNLAILQEVLQKGGDPNQEDEAGSPVLVIAASKGLESIGEALLDAGAAVNKFNRVGQTALSRAAFFGHFQLVRELISRGALVNEAGEKYNLTPLISAANGGHIDVGKLLIDFGANLNDQDALNGFTPLMFATAYGHRDFVKLLIESRANPYIKSFDGAGLYDMVSFSNDKEIHEMLQQYLMEDN